MLTVDDFITLLAKADTLDQIEHIAMCVEYCDFIPSSGDKAVNDWPKLCKAVSINKRRVRA